MNSKEFLIKAQERGFKNFQILKNHTYNQEIECLNNSIVSDSISDVTNYSYKGEIYNKTVKASSEFLEEANIDELEEIARITDSCYQDVYLKNSESILIDETLAEADLTSFRAKLLDFDKLREKYKSLVNLTTNLSYMATYQEILDLNGTILEKKSSTYQFFVSAMCSINNKVGTASDAIMVVNEDELRLEDMVENTIKNAISHLKEEPIVTGKYNIILKNSVVSQMLKKFIEAIDGDLIKKRKSVFVDRLNTNIFNPIINIVEEPLNQKLPGYVTFDNDGTKTYNKDIVKDGVLKTYLYNNKSALDNNTKSTGNNFGTTTCHNMYLKPSDNTFDELIKLLKNGLIVEDFMGSSLTAIDVLTGNISIQILGVIVEDGKIISGYVPCILSSNIFEIFKNVMAIGDDLKFYNKICAAPSILVNNISVSSN